jgi:hypothetical protein
MKAIAAYFGVCYSTVSRAIKDTEFTLLPIATKGSGPALPHWHIILHGMARPLCIEFPDAAQRPKGQVLHCHIAILNSLAGHSA